MSIDSNRTNGLTTGLFHDKDSAERAYHHAIEQGYKPEDVNVMMSEETRKKYYDSPLVENQEDTKAVKGMGVGGAIGAAVGGTIAAIAAMGTALVIPGLGLVVAGPLAAALAGAGAGSVSGGLIGALVGWGIPEEKVREYETGIKNGGVVLGVDESSKGTNLHRDWQTYSRRSDI